MDTRYSIYLWEPETSPHKLPLFYELLEHSRVQNVTFIAQRPLNQKRRLQGWEDAPREDSPIILAPTNEQVEALIANSPEDSIHIFSGMHWVPCIVDGLRSAVRHQRRFGILHEPRVLEGPKGLIRWAHSWLTERHLRNNAKFVLAIGAHGPSWFRLTGYRQQTIFPFAYFLSEPAIGLPPSFAINARSSTRISFLGRLEEIKGIHLFIDSIKHVGSPVEFSVAGHGSYERFLLDAATRISNLSYLGPIGMPEVPQFLAETDVLVLPSTTTDDGWGAVVTEALLAGASVVTSSKVGASMCLADPIRGLVLNRPTGKDLAEAIDQTIANGYCRSEFRKVRSRWAQEHLTRKVGANYLLDILDHLFANKPRPASFVTSP
ncbi:glycosyltransferase involved in cell wall biosynthesis [Bradyrhizobium sp. JR4.1]|uniref:glycosyltransferase family 4 protein n=1 Tax=Bradyrhizobium sp. JR4.1 TaxID=3156372 RepID=UPI003399E01C